MREIREINHGYKTSATITALNHGYGAATEIKKKKKNIVTGRQPQLRDIGHWYLLAALANQLLNEEADNTIIKIVLPQSLKIFVPNFYWQKIKCAFY